MSVDAQLSRISVNGNKLVKEDGSTIVFRGVNASDPGKLHQDGKQRVLQT